MSVMIRPAPRRGLYEDVFWSFTAQGQLRLQQCLACSAWRYPPGPVCPECLDDQAEWRTISGRGRVLGWTVFHRAYFKDFPVPYVVISIETEEGPLLIGNLVGDTTPGIDAPVSLLFEQARHGEELFTLPQWRLVPAAEAAGG